MEKYKSCMMIIFLMFSGNLSAGISGHIDCKSTDFGKCTMGVCASKSQFLEGESSHGEFSWRFPRSLHFKLDFKGDVVAVTKIYAGGVDTTICLINNPNIVIGRWVTNEDGVPINDKVFRSFEAGLSCDDGFDIGVVRVWNDYDDTTITYDMAIINLGVETSSGICEKSYDFHTY